jgi:hypothetical protein
MLYISEMHHWVNEMFLPSMLSTVDALSSSEVHVVFATSCYKHGWFGIGEEEGFRTIRVCGLEPGPQLDRGLSAQEVLIAFVFGSKKKMSAVSKCRGINCEDTCPREDTFPPLEVGKEEAVAAADACLDHHIEN